MIHPAIPPTALRLLAATVVILALVSCADGRLAGPDEKELPPPDIHGPVTMSFCRLDNKAQGDFGGYKMIGALKPIPANYAAEILTRLNDHNAYIYHLKVFCFEPGMGLEIVQGTDRYQLVICLACTALLGYKNGTLSCNGLLGKELLIYLKSVYFDGTVGSDWE
jgi:hypothetical protein